MQKDFIKNIIFDLGHVIINIDPDRSVREMRKLGFDNFEESYSLLSQSHLFDRLEKGLIEQEPFYNKINDHLADKIEHHKIEAAWNAMLLDFPEERINLIKVLSKKYRVFLLSNTNAIHYKKYNADFNNQFGINLDDLFEKAYFSHRLGMRKPDPDIFEHVLNDSDLNPFETLFIDDLDKNIDVAGRMGINTIWINVAKGEDFIQKLNGF